MRWLLVLLLIVPSRAWPALYTECTTFPALGAPQPRYKSHPPIAWVCSAVAGGGALFEWCAAHCAVSANGGQNCSAAKCECAERCMGSPEVCTGSGANPPKDGSHASLPAALAAVGGSTVLAVNGRSMQPLYYTAALQHRVSVAGSGTASSTLVWYLLDAGVGRFGLDADADAPQQWKLSCNETRAAFAAEANETVTLLWTAPPSLAVAVALRVAAATAMGNISINAVVLTALNASSPSPLMAAEEESAGAVKYACVTSQGFTIYDREARTTTRQCASVPAGTAGALSKAACESECYGSAPKSPLGRSSFACVRCAHVYDATRDGGGVAFVDLPETWSCPICGAPKSAYALRLLDDGSGEEVWEHEEQ